MPINILCAFLLFPSFTAGEESIAPPCSYRIIHVYPHNQESFTQGLVYDQGFFYEGTGLWKKSKLLKVKPETGEISLERKLEDRFFGEGITLFQGRLYQLTWLANRGFIYDKDTFAPAGEFQYPTEGWGLTHNGRSLILSDGTARLYFFDPVTFEEKKRISVLDGGQPVVRLNELEWVNGEILANIWLKDRIARIDPESGNVKGWIDLSDLRTRANIPDSADALNGIAYDAENQRLFITGKLWPSLFEIEIVPSASSQNSSWKTYP
ncbi:MAG: glutaminyl-peptide cyclotransferase [Candidatus Omnitrophica bacterium]|nr:glutaminyl-peptide cyclotransferase [Candidatus Omnitrophota bacterium]